MPEIPNVILDETIETEWGNAIRDRVISRYANVTERNALHPSPTEGDFAYMEDTNTVLYYDGTAWRQLWIAGSVLTGGIMGPSGAIPITPTINATTTNITFTPPASWLTYALMAWGALNFTGITELPGSVQVRARMVIAGNAGLEHAVWGERGADAPTESTIPVRHERTGLSGPSLIVIEKGANTGTPAAGSGNNVVINYIATRLT